ncbi:MAG: hypothetical protein EBU08_08270, partial [Micrococcales bacterium]|nr:hypothetical protein [Micrococcales bacterium]
MINKATPCQYLGVHLNQDKSTGTDLCTSKDRSHRNRYQYSNIIKQILIKINSAQMPHKFVPKRRQTAKKAETDEVVVKPSHKETVVKTGIPELPMIDYSGKRDPQKFDRISRALSSYVTRLMGWNGSIFENGVEHEFEEIEQPDEDELTDENDPHHFASAMYIEAMKHRMKSVREYETNKPKVYAIIWGQCTDAMLHKIREAENFDEFDLAKDPLLLWSRIQEILLTGAGENQNPVKVQIEAKREFARMHQYRTETVGDFYQRFIVEQQALEAAEIPIGTPEEQAMEFLNKLDRNRFGPLMADLENAMAAGRDEYPTTLNEAMTRAARYKVVMSREGAVDAARGVIFLADHVTGKKSGHQKGAPKESGSKDKGGAAKGNEKAETAGGPKQKKDKKDVTCFCCQKKGHYISECPLAKKARELIEEEEENIHVTEDFVHMTTEEVVYAAGKGLGPNDVLLDNQATVSVFFNAELLTNIRKTPKPCKIRGVGGEAISVDKVGDFDVFGEVLFSPQANANILSLWNVQRQFQVQYDAKKNIFCVAVDGGRVMDFKPKNRLYVHEYQPSPDYALVQTVEQNELRYTKREVDAANAARELSKRLGYPSSKDLADLIRNGGILNCPVTIADLNRALEIYGPDVGILKGKTVSTKPRIAKVELIPKALNSAIVLCVDLMFANGICFLMSLSERLNLTMTKYLRDRSSETVKDALTGMINFYKTENFSVKVVKSDGEGSLRSLEGYLNSLGITVNFTGKNQHVPQIERKLRVIKERVRAHATTLPFRLTTQLIICLIYYCVQAINSFPTRTMATVASPRELFTGRKLDYRRDCVIEFGQYAQVVEDLSSAEKNTLRERTVDAIAVRNVGNVQGSVEFLSLSTWRLIIRDKWITLPMPRSVIEKLNHKALMDKKFPAATANIDFRLESSGILDDDPDDERVIEQPEEPPAQLLRETPFVTGEQQFYPDQSEDQPPDLELRGVDDDILEAQSRVNETNQSPSPPPPQIDDPSPHVPQVPVIPTHVPNSNPGATPTHVPNPSSGVTLAHVPNAAEELEAQSATHRYNLRPRRSNWSERVFHTSNLEVKRAVEEIGAPAVAGIIREISQLLKKNVWSGVDDACLSYSQKRKVIRSKIFLKLKSSGMYKARLVAGGHMQDRSIYDELSSPTAATQALFMIAGIAASERRHIVTGDIEGAYLNADMKEEVIMQLDPFLAAMVVLVDPSFKTFVREDGKAHVILKKALYGCVESAKLFYEHVKAVLLSIDFVQNPYDQCVFNKLVGEEQITVIFHVDDFMITSTSNIAIKQLIDHMTKVYKKFTITEGLNHHYL